MTNLQIMILAAIQGFTEFLPVSSSGHLILLSKLTSFPDQGLEIDVAVHVGSILAVMIYFYKDILAMIYGLLGGISKKFSQYNTKLFLMLVVGTIPAVIFGLLLHSYGMEWLRNTKIIGWNILIFGILLGWADKHFSSTRSLQDMKISDALIIGFAQCLAMIPGTSRSGVTITVSRILKISRREAARFCMLLSVPAITGAGLLVGYEMYQTGNSNLVYAASGVGYSFIASLLAIWIMMSWLKTRTFLPFVIYRVALGLFLLLHGYGLI